MTAPMIVTSPIPASDPIATWYPRIHRHLIAAEWAFVTTGKLRTTAVNPNCNSRIFPCLSLTSYADICMARKDFVIVDQLSELLRAHI